MKDVTSGSHSTRSSRNRETTALSSAEKLPLADPLVHPPRKPYLLEGRSSVAPPLSDFPPKAPSPAAQEFYSEDPVPKLDTNLRSNLGTWRTKAL